MKKEIENLKAGAKEKDAGELPASMFGRSQLRQKASDS